jgi:hypothetical protein
MQMLGGKAQGALGTAEQAQQGIDKNIGAGEDAMKAKVMEFLKGIMSKAGAGAEGAVGGPASPLQGVTNALDGKPQPPGLSPK